MLCDTEGDFYLHARTVFRYEPVLHTVLGVFRKNAFLITPPRYPSQELKAQRMTNRAEETFVPIVIVDPDQPQFRLPIIKLACVAVAFEATFTCYLRASQ